MFILSMPEIFWLEMHIDGGDAPSKTECVFFRQPGFFSLPGNRSDTEPILTNNIHSRQQDLRIPISAKGGPGEPRKDGGKRHTHTHNRNESEAGNCPKIF